MQLTLFHERQNNQRIILLTLEITYHGYTSMSSEMIVTNSQTNNSMLSVQGGQEQHYKFIIFHN